MKKHSSGVFLRMAVLLLMTVLLLFCACEALAYAPGTTLYVNTNKNGPLYLRQGPSKMTQQMGKYPEGTAVYLVQEWDYAWAKVQVDNKEGFMMLSYLTSLKPGTTATPAPTRAPDATPIPTEDTTMYILTDNGNKLHLRQGAGTSYASLGLYEAGTPVIVTARTGVWAFCTLPDGQHGYMMLRYLTATAPGQTPAPGITPTPVPNTEETVMYIKTGNEGKLHLRETNSTSAASLGLYSNGTKLQVTHRDGNWAYVRLDGKTGWMMLKFLTVTVPG